MTKPYPMKLSPVLKNALWGGKRLSTRWGKGVCGEAVAEAWELSVREAERNIIMNGALCEQTVNEALQKVMLQLKEECKLDQYQFPF